MAKSGDIAGLAIDSVEFPGRAGELHRNGATASLIAELGDNYVAYHEFLAGELKRRKPPRASGKQDEESIKEYLEGWSRLQDVVRAEAVLRACRNYRLGGKLAPDYVREGPLLESGGATLGSIDSPKPSPPEGAASVPDGFLPEHVAGEITGE